MKKLILILSLLETFAAIGQKPININLIKKERFLQPYFVGIDRFESIYYIKGDALGKKMASKLNAFIDL